VRSSDSARATASAVTSSMTVRFVDSGILLSAVSRDREEQDKAARANDLLAARDAALSVQVLQEFDAQVTRAGRPDPLTHEQAAILEAARSLGCDLVLSEDLGDGQDYAGVRVENPFRRWIRGEVLPGDGP
jgi:predicted nucleic acid-binding protein